MDPVSYYFGQATYDERIRQEKVNSILDKLPNWYKIPRYDEVSGSATHPMKDEHEYQVIRDMILNNYRFDEFCVKLSFESSQIVVQWSWCPMEVRVLEMARVLPECIVSRIYELADTSILKARRIFDIFLAETSPPRRRYITDISVSYFIGRSRREVIISKRVRAELLRMVT